MCSHENSINVFNLTFYICILFIFHVCWEAESRKIEMETENPGENAVIHMPGRYEVNGVIPWKTLCDMDLQRDKDPNRWTYMLENTPKRITLFPCMHVRVSNISSHINLSPRGAVTRFCCPSTQEPVSKKLLFSVRENTVVDERPRRNKINILAKVFTVLVWMGHNQARQWARTLV